MIAKLFALFVFLFGVYVTFGDSFFILCAFSLMLLLLSIDIFLLKVFDRMARFMSIIERKG